MQSFVVIVLLEILAAISKVFFQVVSFNQGFLSSSQSVCFRKHVLTVVIMHNMDMMINAKC